MTAVKEVVHWFAHAKAEIWWSIPLAYVGGFIFGRWSKRDTQ